MTNVAIKSLDAVWPRGSAWCAKSGGGMQGLKAGVADTIERAKESAANLSNVRRANDTTLLDELEIDFGIAPDVSVADSERRALLNSKINGSEANAGTESDISEALVAAGFVNLNVYDNSGSFNPAQFSSRYQATAGSRPVVCGNSRAYCGRYNYRILVNGGSSVIARVYRTTAGNRWAVAGNIKAQAAVVGTNNVPLTYGVPVDVNTWPFFFFVAGEGVYSNGVLVDAKPGNAPANRKDELEKLILRLKPMHTWAIMLINYE